MHSVLIETNRIEERENIPLRQPWETQDQSQMKGT